MCWMLLMSILAQPIAAEGLSPYSTSELEQLEKEFVQQINQSESVERNPLANQYINRIGKNSGPSWTNQITGFLYSKIK